MALKKDFQFDTKYGTKTIVPNCYIKVVMVEVSKISGMARVGFFDRQNGVLLEEIIYPFPASLEGVNFISQAYTHLRTLPDFINAEHC